MRLCIVTPENWMLEVAGALSVLGHQIRINKIDDGCEAIMNFSISRMQETKELHKQFPIIPLFVYCWDAYRWCLERPRQEEYDWKAYGEWLRTAREIWSPSIASARSLKENYDLPSEVIRSYAPIHHLVGLQREDKGYVFHAMRDYPDDHLDDLKEICEELQIPFVRSKQTMSLQEYCEAIRCCSFIVSHYEEASTGGLSLLEAAYLGKRCLVSDSLYNGGREYLEQCADVFRSGDKNDLKEKIWELWEDRTQKMIYLPEIFSLSVMAKKIDSRLKTWNYFTTHV